MYNDVSVLYVDVVNLPQICASLKHQQVVDFLNVICATIDEVIMKHGVYKVEAIGDASLMVCGAPRKVTRHAEHCVDCGLAMIAAMGTLCEPGTRKGIEIRAGMIYIYVLIPITNIGIHTGQISAGIVGIKMPRFCLFGDTVTIAYKLQLMGPPMRVLISETTHSSLVKLDAKMFKMTPNKPFEFKVFILLVHNQLN